MNINKKDFNQIKEEALYNINMQPHKKVLPILKALHKHNPKDVDVLKALAHIYYHKKDYKKVSQYVQNALDVNPNDEIALKYKAWVYDETGDKINSMKTLKQIIDTGNADWEVYDQLAEMYEQNGHVLEALGLYTIALRDPNNIQPFHAAIGGANCYSKSGAYEIADEIYDTLLDVRPGDTMILHNKATNYFEQGRLLEAERILQEVISKDPSFTRSIKLLAEIHGNPIPTNNKHLSIDEIDFKSDNSIIFEHEEGKWEELFNDYKDLEKKGAFYEAKKKLETIIEIDDSIAVAWLGLAGLHYTLLEIPEAIECCDVVLSLVKDFSDFSIKGPLIIKSESLFALGKLDEALAIAEEIISLDSTKYRTFLIKARILNRKRDYSGTISILLPVMSMIPSETEGLAFAHYLLATAYYKLGNETEYMKALLESVHLGCEFGTRWFRIKYVAIEGTLVDLLN